LNHEQRQAAIGSCLCKPQNHEPQKSQGSAQLLQGFKVEISPIFSLNSKCGQAAAIVHPAAA
jgi:hypothetical protein